MDGKLRIYIASHKKFDVPNFDEYSPISVGTILRNGDDFGYISDAEGNNISEKNQSFCELTALYWIWKNVKVEIVGLVHYRRYFSKFMACEDEKYFLRKGEILHILDTYDLILPRKIKWKNYTVAGGYDHGAGFKKDLKVIRDIINRRHSEYLDTFDDVCNGHSASYCNMFIMNKSLADKYCEWLFDILFEAESIIDITNYDTSEKRIFGYLSEILLNVWVKNNNLRIYYCPVVWIKGFSSVRRRICAAIEHIPLGKYLVRLYSDYEFNKGQG